MSDPRPEAPLRIARPSLSLALVLAALTLTAARLPAQQLEPRSFPLRDVKSYSLTSPSMGVTYDISIGLPAGYEADPTRKYPTLILTDGNQTFPIALDAARSLASQGNIADLILVSIGSPYEEGDDSWTRRRIYEFSPPDWARTDKFGQGVSGFCQRLHSAEGRCTGGAPKFLNFITTELLPKVASAYRVDLDQLGLFGLSAGGFFAAWTIFQPNTPFKKYIISSPAMAYGDGDGYRQEERYAADHKDLNAGIYLASGSLEMSDPMLEGIGQIVSGMIRLSAALSGRGYPSLKLVTEIHPGLGHSDGASTTLNRGLRVLYAK